jgi:hypothetical protein
MVANTDRQALAHTVRKVALGPRRGVNSAAIPVTTFVRHKEFWRGD